MHGTTVPAPAVEIQMSWVKPLTVMSCNYAVAACIRHWRPTPTVLLSAEQTRLVTDKPAHPSYCQTTIVSRPLTALSDCFVFTARLKPADSWSNVNSHLKWDNHVANVTSKAGKRLWFSWKKTGVSQDDLLYQSVVRPVLEYACFAVELFYKTRDFPERTTCIIDCSWK